MTRKNEIIIFCLALILFGLVLAGGISYFKAKTASDGLLADIAVTIPAQAPAVETIPTSTIITTTSTPTSTSPSSTPPTPLAPLPLPYIFSGKTATSTYWPKAWSSVSFTKNTLALIPDPVHHGANTFLLGDASWTDYAASANVSWLMGGWFDVVARVSNNTQNFVYCEFGPNGTEAIERVNGVDTQLAVTSASTTDNTATTNETLGIRVYGNDIGCTINDKEVVGATVQDGGESLAGGIGFVIFGAPENQKQVTLSDIRASALAYDSIAVPFPVPVVAPPAPTPPPVVITPPAPTPTPTPVTPPPPAPVVTTTTKTLPYFADTFSTSDGWNTYWGSFEMASDSLNIAADGKGSAGGALLDGTNAWDNYTFTANLDWVKGETFGLYARYTNAQNYTICVFTEPYVGDIHITLEQHFDGQKYTLAQGDVTNYNVQGGTNIVASIQVLGIDGSCTFNNSVVSSVGEGYTLNPPYSGRIGFTTWDSSNNNAQIVVHSIDVEPKS